MTSAHLRNLLASKELLVAPGIFDALSARISENAGAKLVYLSGGSSSMTILGMPDAELLGLSDLATHGERVAAAVAIPVIADADTGFGNPMNVKRAVSSYERAGLAGMHIEDQQSPKRCGHLAGKSLISATEFALKLRAAVDARHDPDFLIIARTDARAVEGFNGVLERAKRYADEGVDMIFAEALMSLDEVRRLHEATGLPLLVNQVPGGKPPIFGHSELVEAGCRIVIYPSVLMSGSVLAMELEVNDLLSETLDITKVLPPTELFERVGLSQWKQMEQRYETGHV